jgi:hypothetical protein
MFANVEIVRGFAFSPLIGDEWYLNVDLIYIFFTTNGV